MLWPSNERLYESAYHLLEMSATLETIPNLAEKLLCNKKGEIIPEFVKAMHYIKHYKNLAREKASGRKQWYDIG